MQQRDSNKKPRVFLLSLFRPFFFLRKWDQYIVQQELLPQRREYVNFCFTLSVFGKRKRKLQMEDTSNREPEHFDLTLNAMKLRCIKI